jgi:hypothetical protein
MSTFIRASIGVAGAALVGFHAWLFAGQVAAGQLEDPWLIFRWLFASVLLGAFWMVRRGGDSIFGRRGVAIWVLAALLHGPAVAGTVNADSDALALPEAVATSVLQIVSSTALALGLWLLASLIGSRRGQLHRRLFSFLPAFSAAGPLAAGVAWQFSPRPPPLRS